MATNPVIIGLVGMPGCGKSTVADFFVKKHKAEKIHLGDFIWQWLAKRGIKPNEEAGTMAALYMWVEYGDIPLVKWTEDQIKTLAKRSLAGPSGTRSARESKSKIIILDSLRTVEEARYFQLKYKNNFHVIAILTAPAIRLNRLQGRARFGEITKLEFRIRDREELRLGVGDLIASANHYINANGTIPSVQKQTAELARHLMK